MASEIMMVVIGVLGAYVLLRLLTRKQQKKPVDLFSGILEGEEHKVKGQWGK